MASSIEEQGRYQDGNSIFENVFIQGTLNVATANEKLVVRSDGITIDTIATNSDGKTTFSGDVQINGDELFIADSIKHVGDTDTLISFPSNDTINFRTDGTERLRITSAGDVVINDTTADGNVHPDTKLHIKGGITFRELTSASEGALPAITQWSSDGVGQDLAIGTRSASGDVLFFTGNTATDGDWGNSSNEERLRITSDGKVGIGQAGYVPQRTLDVIGSIRKTVYEPGEIIEQLETQADGNAVTVQSGTYTPANVTAVQNLSTTHTTINGSSFNYTPPTGTTRLIYEFWVFMRDTDVGPLLHFQGRVDGTVVSNSRHTWRAATANADYQMWIYSKMILRVGVTENLSAGDVGTWTSAKTIDFTAREYSSAYEGRFHRTNHWDGASTDITVKPRIRITAIA